MRPAFVLIAMFGALPGASADANIRVSGSPPYVPSTDPHAVRSQSTSEKMTNIDYNVKHCFTLTKMGAEI